MNSTNATTFDINGCTVAIAKMDLQRHNSGDGNYDVLFDLLVDGKPHTLFLQSDEGGDGELSVADFSAGMHEEHMALFEALGLDTTNVGGLKPFALKSKAASASCAALGSSLLGLDFFTSRSSFSISCERTTTSRGTSGLPTGLL